MATRIIELSELIASNTKKIDEYLAANSLPTPSFDEDGPVQLKLSPELDGARSAVMNASAELQALLQGPDALLKPIVSLIPSSSTLPKVPWNSHFIS